MNNTATKEQLRVKADKLQEKRRSLRAAIQGRDLYTDDVRPVIKQIHSLDRRIDKISYLMAHAA